MEVLFNLPPRTQVPAINYGTVVGNRNQPTEPGVQCQKIADRIHRQCSSPSWSLILFRPIDDPDAKCNWEWRGAELGPRPQLRGSIRFNSALAPAHVRRPALARICQFDRPSRPYLNATFHFVNSLKRDTAPSGISPVSSHAPIPKGITLHVPTIPL